ncbi:hypothetical protein [Lacticaseibacillus kribbianus]|uniref:hypothetical protein n=1 Tax=Lacticaseibacillus kribbianus TaxID=2926292 RepID=UPI001CD60F66|nr:hypothetical protein [Lacticaseibacillus kribbianus]
MTHKLIAPLTTAALIAAATLATGRPTGAAAAPIAATPAAWTTTATPDAAPAATADTTAAAVQFTAGDLTLTDVTPRLGFAAATDPLSVAGVWQKGITHLAADRDLTAKVTDFQGLDTDRWTLNVTAGGWQQADSGTAAGAAVLNANAHLSVALGDGLVDLQDGVQLGGGATGVTAIAATTVYLDVPAGTAVKAGSYTNVLDWTLAAGPANPA